jgi:hypothetical protein
MPAPGEHDLGDAGDGQLAALAQPQGSGFVPRLSSHAVAAAWSPARSRSPRCYSRPACEDFSREIQRLIPDQF